MGWQATGWAFKSPIPNPGCKFVLVALAERAGNQDDEMTWYCHPSIKTISLYTAQGYRTIQRHLDWLDDHGFISRVRRMQSKDRQGAYDFTLNPMSCQNGQWPNGAPEVAPNGHAEPVNGTGQVVVGSTREAFDIWWKAYPLKKAKDAASRAFDKAWARMKDDNRLQVLLDGVARYVEEIARTDILIKHPATWLNGGCWDDEPDTNRSQTDGRPATGVDRIAQRHDRVIAPMLAGAQEALDRGGRQRWRL